MHFNFIYQGAIMGLQPLFGTRMPTQSCKSIYSDCPSTLQETLQPRTDDSFSDCFSIPGLFLYFFVLELKRKPSVSLPETDFSQKFLCILSFQGFANLEGMNGIQRFQIHRDERSTDRLPSAHTW